MDWKKKFKNKLMKLLKLQEMDISKANFYSKKTLDIQKPEHIFENDQKDLTMLEAMRESLRHQLTSLMIQYY